MGQIKGALGGCQLLDEEEVGWLLW